MEKPLVSVLLASYNHARYVEAAVRSVMAQTGVSFELIVIDDGSPDESPEILKRLSQELHFEFVFRPNRGLVPTLNEMLAKAGGEFICTLASDDTMLAGRLEKQSAYMLSHPGAVACFGQVRLMDAEGRLSVGADPRYLRGVPRVTFAELLLGEKELHGCTEMIRRGTLLDVGGYDERFKFEDYPLWLALSHRYGPLPVVPDVFCHYRETPAGMHHRLNFIYSQCLAAIALYKEEPLYPEAVRNWKANWFSALAYADKGEALRRLSSLATPSWPFIKRLPKLFIPRKFLRH